MEQYREIFYTGSMNLDCWYGHEHFVINRCGGTVQTIDGYRGKKIYLPGTKILPSRPASIKKVVAISSPCAFKQPGFGTITGSVPWYVGPGQGGENLSIRPQIGPTPEALTDQAVVSLLSEINSPDWEGGVALAELADVVGMFVNPFRALNKVCRNWQKSLKSARKAAKSVRSYLDVVSNSWLQWRYGIVPLMADIETIKTLYERTEPKLDYIINRAGNSNNGVRLTRSYNARCFSNTTIYKVERVESSFTKSIAKALYSISVENGTNLGFGVNDIIPGLWELIPFSFVGDWFWNTGDWLRAKSPRPGLSIVDSCLSIKRQRTVTWDIVSWNADPGGRFIIPVYPWTGGGQASITWSTLDRIPLPPISSLPKQNPSFYKWRRALDSAALSWNLIPPIFGKRRS